MLKHHFDNLEQQHASERLGMWMFLATEVLFFGGLFGAYTVYRHLVPGRVRVRQFEPEPDDRHGQHGAPDHEQPDDDARDPGGQARQTAALIRYLLVTAALGTAFMVMKGFEYAEDFHEKYVPGHCSSTEYELRRRTKSPRRTRAEKHEFSPERQHWAQDLAGTTARRWRPATSPGKVQLFLVLLLRHDRHPRDPHHRRDRVHPVAGLGGVAREDPAGELLHGRGGQPVLALGGRDLAVPDAAAVPGRRGVSAKGH